MTLVFNEIIHEEAYGATASFFSEEVKHSDPINVVLLTMKFLQDGATLPTIANVLTQFGSNIKIKIGGRTAFDMSPTDLYKLMQFLNRAPILCHVSDGTGTDDHVMSATLIVPLGLEVDLQKINGDYGIDPSKAKVVVEVDFPADANNIDTRKLSIVTVGVVGKKPVKYVRRTTTNFTPNAANDSQFVDLPYGSGEILVDVFAYQTTSLGDGTTSDIKTIEKIAVQLNTNDIYLADIDSEAFEFYLRNMSALATSPEISSDYLYIPLGDGNDKYNGIKLDQQARFRITAGDTNATRLMHGIVVKHP